MYQQPSQFDPFTLPSNTSTDISTLTTTTTPTPTQKHLSPTQFLWRSMIGLAILSGLLIATKPSKLDYDKHIAEILVSEAQDTYCQGIQLPQELQGLGNWSSNFCKSAIAGGGTIMGNEHLQAFAQNSSTCKSYMLFIAVFIQMGYRNNNK